MESWRKVWREGIAPQLSTMGLEALRKALITDDTRLIQGKTTDPYPLTITQGREPVEAGCGITYCGWQGGEGVDTVGEAEEYFSRVCFYADQNLEEPTAIRYFLNWFDETPREKMRRLLLAEVNRTLAQRVELEGCETEKRKVVTT